VCHWCDKEMKCPLNDDEKEKILNEKIKKEKIVEVEIENSSNDGLAELPIRSFLIVDSVQPASEEFKLFWENLVRLGVFCVGGSLAINVLT
jgi:hypothetical protein